MFALLALFAKGFAIGAVFGVPIGAIGALVVERTLSNGTAAGLATGMGCAVVDLIYATVGAAGLTAVFGFVQRYEQAIGVGGGVVVMALGASMLLRQGRSDAGRSGDVASAVSTPGGADEYSAPATEYTGLAASFWSSFAIAASNPATILLFLVAFSLFEVGPVDDFVSGCALVAGVFLATSAWWLALVALVSKLGNHLQPRTRARVVKACGVVVILLGVFFVFRSLS